MAVKNFKNNIFLFIVIFFLGIIVGLFLDKINIFKVNKITGFSLKRLFKSDNYLSNPLIQFETPEGNDLKLESIKYDIQEYIKECIKNGDALSMAVYLRDLDKGTWIGINEEERFAAASLLKIPILLAYLKKSEQEPSILSKEIKYEAKLNDVPSQNILPQNNAQLGQAYIVEELLRNMIVSSDNISGQLLSRNMDSKLIASLYSDLDLRIPDLKEKEHQISCKDYATFFRTLYNATYLHKELSEKALKLLTQTDFRDGIVAGVPENITIAHKFAERRYTEGGAQLHDCGIVYYPKSPYLLCIMTKGEELETLKKIIKNISKIIYERKEKKFDVF
jgi:beta-lactamase class A